MKKEDRERYISDSHARSWLVIALGIILLSGHLTAAHAQLGENCTAIALNRTAQVAGDGTFVLAGVPVPAGPFRVRFICEGEEGVDLGQTDLLEGISGDETALTGVNFNAEDTLFISITLSSPTSQLTPDSATAQLTVVRTQAALAHRAALLGTIPTGTFPRELAVEPGRPTLLVGNFGSDQLEAVDLSHLP